MLNVQLSPDNLGVSPTPNDPAKAGKYASDNILFISSRRYRIRPVHTRFDFVTWFVWDNGKLNDQGDAEIIRIEPNFYDAIRGLNTD